MYYVKGFSIVGVLAVGGLFTAVWGVLGGWFLFPYLVSISVDMVSGL